MKRTILALLVAGLFAGIGTSAMAQDAAAKKKEDTAAQSKEAPGANSNSQQPSQTVDPAQSGATNTPPAMSEEGSAGKQAEGDATNAPQAKSDDGTAGKKEGDATNASQAKSDEGSAGNQPESGATAAPSEEYTAALKACDNLTGNYKSQCVDEAKKKHGQM